MSERTTYKIFLSHSQYDTNEVLRFGRRLYDAMSKNFGLSIEVFNTSEFSYRFNYRNRERLADKKGISFLKVDLSDYLWENLLSSTVYILYLTQNSVIKKEHWIEYEINKALELRRRKKIAFIPCVTGTFSFSNKWDLPEEARRYHWADISSEEGFRRLIETLASILVESAT